LNPPPPSFARTADSRLPYGPFPYMALTSKGSHLDAGFPLIAPALSNAAPGQPHPFATHDIQEADWTRFLEDIAIAALLKTSQRVVAGLVPLALHVGLAGIFVSLAMERYMKKRKGGVVGELIDIWNSRFFNPRRMDVVLALGETRFSGRGDGPLPDRDQQLDYIPPGTSDIHLEEDDRQSRKRARRELKQRKRK
ncbi:hypothetical protein PUNSTDRAFT_17956, partial [Punctularia strigosozonata HHB-11173 SS5]|uniref:uncharacterized protein n=1 Tax=Punctularia strigosozonata (strain HHB-11173) TaxID=741275 RepID=UPI0004416438